MDDDWHIESNDLNEYEETSFDPPMTTKHKSHKLKSKHHLLKVNDLNSGEARNATAGPKRTTSNNSLSLMGDLKDKRRHFYIPSKDVYSLGKKEFSRITVF